MAEVTLTVAGLLDTLDAAVGSAVPGPVWVRGEVSGFQRTSHGAAFFRLVDPERPDNAIEVAASGRMMMTVTHTLESAGVGGLRSGIEVRVRATVGVRHNRGHIQLSLLEVDPSFTAGRLALDRHEVLRRLAGDGSLAANKRLELPTVPLRIGLVTSRGSAAHADFLDQLRRPGYRFSVRTVQAAMQGDRAVSNVVQALRRLGTEDVDVVAVVRGGGSKLDLASFDAEEVGRAVAAMPVPVITGIGHETDRTVADEAAAVSLKTPTAAAEWIVARVADYAARVDTATHTIRDAARSAWNGAVVRLDHWASQVAGTRTVLRRQMDDIDLLEQGVIEGSRTGLQRHRDHLSVLAEMFAAIGVGPTLRRGFALVTRPDGSVVRSAGELATGDRVAVRLADGSVMVVVEER
ncbi:MAG TPA: exodeoxyribonuclease VII large subunit [Acidimicrobiia bacterium]|nr:exodeoxyribonuclease VII large subunit [Acidimicrobiia bacterium]